MTLRLQHHQTFWSRAATDFDQYTYGRIVIINNDHRPLETILKKPQSQSPKRLQSLIMRLNRYDISFCYVPKSALVIADTLSRAVATINDNAVSRFLCIFNVDVLEDIPDERLLAVKRAMINDQESGCRTVSNNCSGSGLAPAENILAVQVWFGFT